MHTGSQNVTIGSSISAVTLQYPASQWILNDFHMQKSESIHFRWAVQIRKYAIVNHYSFRVSSTALWRVSQNTHHVPEEKLPTASGKPPAGVRHQPAPHTDHRETDVHLSGKKENLEACCVGKGKPALRSHVHLERWRKKGPISLWAERALSKCLWWPLVVILQNPTLKAIMDSRSYVPSYYWDGLLGGE